MSFEVSGLVKLPLSAQSAVHAKERTADAIANGLILKKGGGPAGEYKWPWAEKSLNGRSCGQVHRNWSLEL